MFLKSTQIFMIILLVALVGLGFFLLIYKQPADDAAKQSGDPVILDKLTKTATYTYLIKKNEPMVKFGIVDKDGGEYAVSLSLSHNNPGKLVVENNQVVRKNILPFVDWGYQVLSDEFRHQVTIANAQAQRVFAFNLDKSSDNLEIRDENGVGVTVVKKDSQEELFELGYPMAQDAKQNRLYYRYRILGGKLIVEPVNLDKWRNVVYPVVLSFVNRVREFDEVLVKVGQNGVEAGNAKDGDVVMIKPAGWQWGKDERKNFVVVRIKKLSQTAREAYLAKEGETNSDLAGAYKYGIDYTKLATDKELKIIRDFEQENPILDASQYSVEEILKEKANKRVSLIPAAQRLEGRPGDNIMGWKKLVKGFISGALAVESAQHVSTVGVGGSRDYSSLSAWEAAREGDLVADNAIEVAECYDDGDMVDRLTISGWVTGASNYIKIYTPVAERHTGTKNNGFEIVNSLLSGGGATFDIREDYVRLEGLVMRSAGSYHTIQVVGADEVNSDIRISQNIIYHTTLYSTQRRAIVVNNGRVKIWNNSLHCSPAGVSLVGIWVNGGTSYIYHNSFYQFAAGVSQTSGTAVVKNTAVLGDGSGNFSGTFDAASDYNCSSDNTAPGAWSTANCRNKLAADNYYSVAEGFEDLHIKDANADIYNMGTNLSGDANCPVTDDFEGDARATDIGSDEYVTSYPDPVTGLQGSPLINTITWAWSDPNLPSADYYAVYGREGDVGGFNFLENTNSLTYIYPNPGSPSTSYWLRVYACGNIFGCNPVYTEINQTTLSGSGENPVSDFEVCVLNDDSAYFTDHSYDPDGGEIQDWEWDFGDGSGSSSNQDPAYQYDPATPGWWDSDWGYRKKITFNTSAIGVATNQESVPVYIKQGPGDVGFWENTHTVAKDLRFVDMDGTELNYELERFDFVGQYMDAWVKVPQVAGSTTTDYIWMYYGNGQASPMDEDWAEAVWQNGYVMVQHLAETSGNHDESTSYDNDAKVHGSVNQNATGKIDGADEFFTSNDYLDVSSDSGDELSNMSSLTIEAWVKFDTLNVRGAIINKPHDQWMTNPWVMWGLANGTASSNANLRMGISTSLNVFECKTADNSISTGSFYYLSGTWNGSQMQVYINGVPGRTNNCLAGGTLSQNNEDVVIGRYPQGFPTLQGIDGVIDEARVSNVARSDDWIKFQYASMMQTVPVLTYGDDDPLSSGVYGVTLGVTDDEGQFGSSASTLYLDTASHCTYLFIASANIGCNAVGLSWDNAPGANTYEIYRSDNGGSYNLLVTLTKAGACTDSGCSYDDTTVSMDTTYAYYIKANTDFNYYYNSTSVPACTGNESTICSLSEITPLCSPENLSVVSTPCGAVVLSWPAVAGVDGYQLERSLIDADELYAQIGGGDLTETAYSDQGIIPGVTYYYRVRSAYPGPEYSEYTGPVSGVSYCYRGLGYSED